MGEIGHFDQCAMIVRPLLRFLKLKWMYFINEVL